MSDVEFSELFDSLAIEHISKSHVRTPSQYDEKILSLPLKITSAAIKDGQLWVTMSDSGFFALRIRGSNGREMAAKTIHPTLDESGRWVADLRDVRFKILAVELVNKTGVILSNSFPLSNFDQISSSASDVDTPAIRREVEANNPDVIHQIEKQYFIFEREHTERISSDSTTQLRERDFWKSSDRSHSSVWGAGYPLLSYAVQAKIVEPDDEPTATNEPTDKPKTRKQRVKPTDGGQLFAGWPWAPNLEKVIAKNYRRLLKATCEGIKPDEDRWALGLEHYVRYLIKPLVEQKANLGENEVDEFAADMFYREGVEEFTELDIGQN